MTTPQIKHRYTDEVLYEGKARMTTLQMLEKAALDRADLIGADLYGAGLRGANLRGADLRGADLRGAKIINGLTAVGDRPYFSIGPIGSSSDNLVMWLTEKGPYIDAGGFWGALDAFAAAVKKTHGDNEHAKEYGMVVRMCEAHAAIWTPKENKE